jgi:hypothetical protein
MICFFCVGSRCCSDEKVRDDAIILREDLTSIYSVVVEEPTSEV